MNPIRLHLSNLQRGTNFIRVGVPFPPGEVVDCNTLTVCIDDQQESQVPAPPQASVTHKASALANIKPAALWADGSVKWGIAKISIQDCVSPNLDLSLQQATQQKTLAETVIATESSSHISIQCGPTLFEFSRDRVFPTVKTDNVTKWSAETCHPQLTLTDGSHSTFEIQDVSITELDEISCKVQITGAYEITPKQQLHAKYLFEISGGALTLVSELHNPHRALHPGGIWDLGDPGSIGFIDFSLQLQQPPATTTKFLPETNADWIDAPGLTTLFQASSGGVHWDNAVHVSADGTVHNKFSGYQLTTDEKIKTQGKRSNPLVALTTPDGGGYTVRIENFWQNFPKSIDNSAEELCLRLFPHHHGGHHELQGGERKTHKLTFSFYKNLDQTALTHSEKIPVARVDATAYKAAGVFSYFDNSRNCELYNKLLEPSKSADKGFFAKREQLDEYGWRNFGDVYADHEAAYHTEDWPYVSHYNNQYDSIYGFARQYALTGDETWQSLFTDLAKHVMDIDIYRTDEDRVEYNNGFFWHTDHYVEAKTATHRTYSSAQVDRDGNPSHGGGPGPQHCYSTGLAYYYFLTGDEEAKKTVLGLGDWIHNYYEGTGTVLEAAKKTLQEETPSFIKTCKGAKIFKYKYPMDRGTGNYIRTLMDCFDLTADSKYLQQVESIIRNTAGPHDEIEARGLEDTEYTWFYKIFLQEVVRYLDLKRSLDQHDNSFYHARAMLLHYARWMVDNEVPYLENADRLDYPNATWTAQDVRKIHIFYAAYKYALKDRSVFLERARYIRDYVADKLANESTLHYARIQILLLQNHGPSAHIDMDSLPYPGIREITITDQDGCFHTPKTHLKHIAGTWASCLTKFRISNELRWIKTRAS